MSSRGNVDAPGIVRIPVGQTRYTGCAEDPVGKHSPGCCTTVVNVVNN